MRSPDAQPQLAAGSAAHASVVSQEEEEEKEKVVVVEVGVRSTTVTFAGI